MLLLRRCSNLVVVALPLVTACVGSSKDGTDADYAALVLRRASIELACDPVGIRITGIEHQTYLAEGCGYREVYECGIPNGHEGANPCLRAPELHRENEASVP